MYQILLQMNYIVKKLAILIIVIIFIGCGSSQTTSPSNNQTSQPNNQNNAPPNNGNQKPTLHPIGNKSIAEGNLLQITASASDPDGDALTYSATGLPSGATFDSTTQTFNWTPTYSQAGNYKVTFMTSDGSLNSYETVTITVGNVNLVPVLNPIGAKAVSEGANLNIVISGSAPDGDALTYSATGLPSGATFDSISHTFDWTPTYNQVGSHTITFIVTDGSLTTSEEVTIIVSLKLAKIELKNQINIKQDVLGYVHYLGELVNTGDLPACFIKIDIDSKNAGGNLIDTDFTYVDGSSMLANKTIMIDTCLRGGEFGGFELSTILKELPSSFSYKINWDATDITEPLVSPSQITIDGSITETVDYWGNKKVLGFIKNLHPSITVKFVKITFVALNGINVIDTDFTYVNGSSCSVYTNITTDTCLTPGETGSFSIIFNEPPSAVTDYYFKISY